MKTKIPPPIVTLVFGLCIYLSSSVVPVFAIDYGLYIGLVFQLLSLGVMGSSVLSFKKQKTTVNPLKPETASSLVVKGFFCISRNPMYLGMLGILVGIAIQLNIVGGMLFVPLFVIYMTIFQIIPEEQAMGELFGKEYDAYRKSVRRWL